MRTTILTVASVMTMMMSSCTGGDQLNHNHPPVARLEISPSFVPKGRSTEVLLDASRSCDELDSPEGCGEEGAPPRTTCPGGVKFDWAMGGAFQVVSSADGGSKVTVNLTAEKPVEVILTVTDCDGRATTIHRWIGITL